jgi:hypothetical protein
MMHLERYLGSFYLLQGHFAFQYQTITPQAGADDAQERFSYDLVVVMVFVIGV